MNFRIRVPKVIRPQIQDMNSHQEKIDRLINQLELLTAKQQQFSLEIQNLRKDLHQLKSTTPAPAAIPQPAAKETQTTAARQEVIKPSRPVQSTPHKPTRTPGSPKFPELRSDLEKFIGENLISKIGIAITIFGVAIGVKYSIENNLISPLTRIVLGYLSGFILLGLGMKLKQKYHNYSAVLVSGAMAIMYFITYAAYDFYSLIPQIPTFMIMVIFTVFTVLASLNYNKQVIAHIGLTGAYAIPFLLSDGSGQAAVLFSYMTIINIGILFTSFKKYWKPLYYTAFLLTWIIFLSWYGTSYNTERDLAIALTFNTLFFVIFYLTFLAYKTVPNKKFEAGDILLLLANSFIFYGIGYSMLSDHEAGRYMLGIFTVCNAAIHFITGRVIYKKQLADKNLFYLITGLVLVFLTIAVPVQLDGTWVSSLWAVEAALLFWIGHSKKEGFYERLSFPLMIIAVFSLTQDWIALYGNYSPEVPGSRLTPLINVNFLASVIVIAAFAFINKLHRDSKGEAWAKDGKMVKLVNFSIPAILLFLIYFAFRLEVGNYWTQRFADSFIDINPGDDHYLDRIWNEDLLYFKKLSIILYSLLFASLLSWLNFKKIGSKKLSRFNLALIAVAMIVFLIQGLYVLSELRVSYLEQSMAEYYNRDLGHIVIRYISLAFAALAGYSAFKHFAHENHYKGLRKHFDLALHITVIWLLSSELIHWMDMAHSQQSYKLGLSILWGTYSLHLIALGIWKKKKHLRLMAIILFGITLVKLFFYDIAHLNTIAKTIVFVSLGVLLLIISFLYNKYKLVISDETNN